MREKRMRRMKGKEGLKEGINEKAFHSLITHLPSSSPLLPLFTCLPSLSFNRLFTLTETAYHSLIAPLHSSPPFSTLHHTLPFLFLPLFTSLPSPPYHPLPHLLSSPHRNCFSQSHTSSALTSSLLNLISHTYSLPLSSLLHLTRLPSVPLNHLFPFTKSASHDLITPLST